MKKYVLFQYDAYYPSGGLNDITGSFDTVEEAKQKAKEDKTDHTIIVDRDTWEIVWSF
jgi:hypothetical protein